ncbi:Mediator of RNA polymerase II transcription subunit 10a [Capsicum annuum]|nr:Mediator of RNA polymerase II transcription subunit 10a [Capsicum annuum]
MDSSQHNSAAGSIGGNGIINPKSNDASPVDSAANATGSPAEESKQNLNQVINSIDKTLGILHQLYLTVSAYNVSSQFPLLQRMNNLVVELDNMARLGEKCNIQVPMEVLNLIDDGKNPDEFTRDVLNSCISKNQITKGKTDAFKVENLTRNIEKMQTDLASLKGDVTSIKGDMTTMGGRSHDNGKPISRPFGDVTLGSLKELLVGVCRRLDVIDDRMGNMEGRVENIEGRLSSSSPLTIGQASSNPPNQNLPNQEDDSEFEEEQQHGEGDEYVEEEYGVRVNIPRRRGGYRGRGVRLGPMPQRERFERNQERVGCQGEYYGNQEGCGTRDSSFNTIKVTLPTFKGGSDPKAYLNWELQCERIFQTNDLTEIKKATYAIAQFEGFASTWWESMRRLHRACGQANIPTCERLKELMRNKYVLEMFKQEQLTKFYNLKQGSKSVEEYYDEF